MCSVHCDSFASSGICLWSGRIVVKGFSSHKLSHLRWYLTLRETGNSKRYNLAMLLQRYTVRTIVYVWDKICIIISFFRALQNSFYTTSALLFYINCNQNYVFFGKLNNLFCTAEKKDCFDRSIVSSIHIAKYWL